MSDFDEVLELIPDGEKDRGERLVKNIKRRLDESDKRRVDLQQRLQKLYASLEEFADQGDSSESADQVAEHQRVCEQYRYRDRLLVQEFYFAIVVVGLAGNLIRSDLYSLPSAIASIGTTLLLFTLWIHLSHLREDRNHMWTRARELEDKLNMEVMNRIWTLGYSAKGKKRIVNGTYLMSLAVISFAILWLGLTGVVMVGVSDSVATAWDSLIAWLQPMCEQPMPGS